MSTSNKVFLVTGAGRGIGLAFTKAISADSNNVVLATARDPANATALNALAAKLDNIHVLKLDVASDDSIAGLDAQLKEFAADGIDYFISNAAIGTPAALSEAIGVPKSVWVEHFTTNVLGPVLITQAVYPYLLKRSTRVIYFVSSNAGSIGGFVGVPTSAYGMSKAALNHVSKSFASELAGEGFIVVAVHPGVVDTDANKAFLELSTQEVRDAFKSIVIPPEESATKQLELMKKLTKEDSGKFFVYDGDEMAW